MVIKESSSMTSVRAGPERGFMRCRVDDGAYSSPNKNVLAEAVRCAWLRPGGSSASSALPTDVSISGNYHERERGAFLLFVRVRMMRRA